MTYKEQADKALKAKNVRIMTPKFILFEQEGQEICGKYCDNIEVEKGEKEKNYFQYMFITDNGLVKFHMGSVADAEFGRQFVVDHVYYLRYDGKEAIGGGKSVNKFFCAEIGGA